MATHPDSPIPESYWVQPGQLLAGAYPILAGEAEAAMRQRVQRFLAVGITAFVDLTETHEFVPYFPFVMAGVSEGTPPPRTLINCLDCSSERVDTTGGSVLL
jgi:hypothetical protein